MSRRLCRLEDLADPGAKGFSLRDDRAKVEIFVVRSQGEVRGYVNSCPHIGTPLDFLPDRFLTRDRTEILCSTHGARFEIATGLCLAGPCKGRALTGVPLAVDAGWVRLK
ncbi:MAG TPA: Rieske (2Fe-2S) protein [Alphaproteobacteria bacterium]